MIFCLTQTLKQTDKHFTSTHVLAAVFYRTAYSLHISPTQAMYTPHTNANQSFEEMQTQNVTSQNFTSGRHARAGLELCFTAIAGAEVATGIVLCTTER